MWNPGIVSVLEGRIDIVLKIIKSKRLSSPQVAQGHEDHILLSCKSWALWSVETASHRCTNPSCHTEKNEHFRKDVIEEDIAEGKNINSVGVRLWEEH